MRTIVEDKQLREELQELYIIAEHWVLDVQFIQDEIIFLKHMVNKYLGFNHLNEYRSQRERFDQILEEQVSTIPGLIAEINKYLKHLKPLIGDSKKDIDINLLEEFSNTGEQMQVLSATVKLIKRELFDFIEQIMTNRP